MQDVWATSSPSKLGPDGDRVSKNEKTTAQPVPWPVGVKDQIGLLFALMGRSPGSSSRTRRAQHLGGTACATGSQTSPAYRLLLPATSGVSLNLALWVRCVFHTTRRVNAMRRMMCRPANGMFRHLSQTARPSPVNRRIARPVLLPGKSTMGCHRSTARISKPLDDRFCRAWQLNEIL